MPNEVSANQVFSAKQVLANEAIAPLPEVALSEPDYRAFCAALEASARGRAFLAEYARRNRHADTETVLAALDRLETLVRSQAASSEADRIRQELRALLAALHGAQPLIDASPAAIKAAKLAALIGFVQHRIESIVAPEREPSTLPPEVAALILSDEAAPEAVRVHLSVVPPAEQPELPIPAPAAGPPPAIALVQAEAMEPPEPAKSVSSVAIIPEVNLFDGAPAKSAVVEPKAQDVLPAPIHPPFIPAQAGIQESNLSSENVGSGSPLARGRTDNPASMETALATETAAAPPPAVFELTLLPPAVKTPATTTADPLAHIMALSDAERIALFS